MLFVLRFEWKPENKRNF